MTFSPALSPCESIVDMLTCWPCTSECRVCRNPRTTSAVGISTRRASLVVSVTLQRYTTRQNPLDRSSRTHAALSALHGQRHEPQPRTLYNHGPSRGSSTGVQQAYWVQDHLHLKRKIIEEKEVFVPSVLRDHPHLLGPSTVSREVRTTYTLAMHASTCTPQTRQSLNCPIDPGTNARTCETHVTRVRAPYITVLSSAKYMLPWQMPVIVSCYGPHSLPTTNDWRLTTVDWRSSALAVDMLGPLRITIRVVQRHQPHSRVQARFSIPHWGVDGAEVDPQGLASAESAHAGLLSEHVVRRIRSTCDPTLPTSVPSRRSPARGPPRNRERAEKWQEGRGRKQPIRFLRTRVRLL